MKLLVLSICLLFAFLGVESAKQYDKSRVNCVTEYLKGKEILSQDFPEYDVDVDNSTLDCDSLLELQTLDILKTWAEQKKS